MCVKYESSTKWATQGIKEQIYDVMFAGSEPDSSTDQLIKTAQGVIDWLKIYPNLVVFVFSFFLVFILFFLFFYYSFKLLF